MDTTFLAEVPGNPQPRRISSLPLPRPRPSRFPILFRVRTPSSCPIDLLSLETRIGKEFIAKSVSGSLYFAHHLFTYTNYRYFPSQFTINPNLLTDGWVPPYARKV